MLTFSTEQERALAAVSKWLKTKDWSFTLTGAAGCGKSTIAQRFDGEGVLYCSPTGKGADALRKRSNVQASTVHKVLYKPKEKGRGRIDALTQELETLQRAQTPDVKRITAITSELRAERKRLHTPSWSVPPDAECKTAKLLVVDECFMLNEQIISDLRQNTKKVLFLGDPYQLPPVAGDCPLAAAKPDAHLTEVHRQALDNPILYAATEIRKGKPLPRKSATHDGSSYRWLTKKQTGWPDYKDVEQIIVAKNATRRQFNERYRSRLGHTAPCRGDRIIFLKNDHDLGIYNGSVGEIQAVTGYEFEDDRGRWWDDCLAVSVKMDDGRYVPDVPVWAGVLDGKHMADSPRGINVVDYGYCVTMHKAQGSEYGSVLVYDEGFGTSEVHRRWLYTGVTRAKTSCTVVGPSG